MRISELSENTKEEAEQDFGKVLFGDLKFSDERDTELEKEIYVDIRNFIRKSGNDEKIQAAKSLNHLKKFKEIFPDDLIPDANVVYRGTKLKSEEQLVSILDHKSLKLEKNNIIIDFTYKPTGVIQSWSTTMNVANKFGKFSLYPVTLAAKVDDSFILRSKLTNLFGATLKHVPENEVIRLSNNPIKTKLILDLSTLKESGLLQSYIDKLPITIEHIKENPNLLDSMNNSITPELILELVGQIPPLYVGKLYNNFPDKFTDKALLKAVQNRGIFIRHIKNPSDGLQIAAVKEDGRALMYIDDPCVQAQLVAVKENPEHIEYIQDPDNQIIQYYEKMTGKTFKPFVGM